MLKNKISFKIFAVLLTSAVIITMIIFPDICKSGISRGLLICGNVIIPSLFPFTVCVLMIMNFEITFKNKVFSKILYFVFGQNFEMFSVMIFSMLGGYPVGCKLIDELYLQNKIDKKTANIMQMYCVNAGPAFIITAVGFGVLGSKDIGIILFVSHILSSFLIAIFVSKFTRNDTNSTVQQNIKKKKLSDIFVNSTADASSAVMSVCTFVILFSCINSYLVYFFKGMPILKNIFYFTEVTYGVTCTKNVIFVSFLLGFSGLSIWCQIFSLSKNAIPDLKLFIFGRLLHGGISSIITLIVLKFLKLKQKVFSNNLLSSGKLYYTNAMLSASMAVMVIVLAVYIYSKNNSRKLINDMV